MASASLPPLAAKLVILAVQKRQASEHAASVQFTADVAAVAESIGVAADVTVSYTVLPSGAVTAEWGDASAVLDGAALRAEASS